MKRNKIKQSEYKVISNPLEGYRFSLSSCNAAAIGAYIISLVIAISLSMLVLLYENDECDWNDLRECSGYILVFSLPVFLMGVWQTLWTRKVKRIITNGEQVDGKIVSYCRYKDFNSDGALNATLLYVIFDYHGKQYCTVPAGKKRPEKALASPYCKVYILDDKIFVTDFELRKKGDPVIEFIEKDIQDMNNDQIQ
ncbi:MAG: hypothetical protein IKJ60_09600 [Ruminococcus sp.]|nr:hypothetical protein [Ruminococcus sp.]